ncbi:hypothetical protein ACIQGT_14110 [Streptomyces sp. NPDC093108]|uniref:hypothetical protein n=1 Tax=unclassified Streptomyces TaxID=2593676 RepID=UPI00380EC696
MSTNRVDQFLNELDDVLNSLDPAAGGAASDQAPAVPPAREAAPAEAAETPDDAAAREGQGRVRILRAPANLPRPVIDWWTNVYRDDRADLDTFTANHPKPLPGRQLPEQQPGVEQEAESGAGAGAEQPTVRVVEGDTPTAEAAEAGPAPSPVEWALGQLQKDRYAHKGKKTVGPLFEKKQDGLVNNARGRQVVFAVTAYGAGWSLNLSSTVDALLRAANELAIPFMGWILWVGLLALLLRNRVGAIVFVSSLVLILLMSMGGPERVVGLGLILASYIVYRIVRGWTGEYGTRWPWKGVVWAAHIPVATTAAAYILHGTNH